MSRRLVPLAAAISLLLAPQAHALGLGAIEVRSALDEPLLAEIQLVSVRPGELDELRVALASGADFQRAGVTRVGLLSQLDFELTFRESTPYIRVTTPRPIREPFLNFLVEANWSSGRMLREYTVLLDPPTFIAGDAPPMDTPATSAPQLVQRESAPARAPRASAAAPVERPVRAATGALEYGPTKSRDTLWKIAEELRPDDSVSVYQMMIALQRENPEAFDDANVNRLRAGYTLRIADMETIAAVSHREAVAEFREQTATWREATRQAAEPQPSSGVLRLVAPDTDEEARRAGGATSAEAHSADAEAELVALRRELSLARETAEAERRRNEELSARLEELADQVETVHRLLSLEDQDMARLQAQLAAQLNAQAGQPAEPAQADETSPGEQSAPAEQAAQSEQTAPVATPAERPASARAPEPVPPPAWYEIVEINPLYAAGGAGLLLLGGAMWAMRRRRRGAQESILAPAAAGAPWRTPAVRPPKRPPS
ncbi:hypothetical protein HUS23_12640 [Ectothiorhodospiraceae bacterium 2226]|nr:hypothetical protein HUS23_12640 [Ectothiorhodospiraceae bacterium 2226]